jgi:hypothetical protein
MTTERFYELMEGDSDYKKHDHLCRITQGLIIITKYTPKFGLEAAEHDKVYAGGIDRLIEAGITEEDVTTLRELGWGIDEFDEGLYHFA